MTRYILEDLDIDCYTVLAIAIDLEDSMGIRLLDEDIDKWATVGDIEAAVQQASEAVASPLQPPLQGL